MSDKITFHEAGQEISKGEWISQLATGMQKEIDELKHRISELEAERAVMIEWMKDNIRLIEYTAEMGRPVPNVLRQLLKEQEKNE